MSTIAAVSATPAAYAKASAEPRSAASTLKGDQQAQTADARTEQQAQGQLVADQAGKAKQTVIASDKSALSRAEALESQAAAVVSKDQTLLDVTV